MTTPRTPDRFRTELEDIGDTISKLKSLYPDAYQYAYWPAQGGGSGKITQGRTDPTSSTFAIRGRIRGLLRKANNRLNAAIMALEEAHEALDDCFDQGPQLRPSMPERIPCSHCGKAPVWRQGLCGACFKYQQRNGRPRPGRLLEA